jgi:hypothetical protein
MDNSRSLEALYQDGTGMVSLPKKSYKASIEGYDGFDDILSADLAKSEENLAFLDTFQMIEAKNAADKIKMCKKLSANYGKRSGIPTAAATSVESLCHMMSLEADADANAAGVNTGNEEAADKPETTKKKGEFFKTIFKAIKDFFKRIWDVFVGMISKIGSLFKKKDAPTETETKTSSDTVDMNVNGTSDNKTATSSAMNGRETGSKLNLDYEVFVDISKFNPAGIKNFSSKYQNTSKAVKTFSEGLKKAERTSAEKRNTFMDNEGKKLIEAIDATSSIVTGVADRRKTLGARGDAKSIKAALDAASKDLRFEAGSDNVYTVLQSLFGVTEDKTLRTAAEEKKQVAKKYLEEIADRKSRMQPYVVKSIKDIPSQMKPSHELMVKICDEYEANINNYLGRIGYNAADPNKGQNNNASEYYTSLTVLTSALKVCTKIEQVVVKAVSAMIKIVK